MSEEGIPTQYGTRAAAQDGGILSVLAVNVVVAVTGFGALLLARHASALAAGGVARLRATGAAPGRILALLEFWFPRRAIDTQSLLDDGDADRLGGAAAAPPPLASSSVISWLWALVRMGNDEVLERCGHDALVYLQFQKLVIVALTICSVLCLGMVLPVNLAGDKSYSGFRWTTIDNVGDSDWYWVHAVASVLVSIVVLVLIFRVRLFALSSNESFHLRRSAISFRTIMIQNAHPMILSPDLYQQHFSAVLHTAITRLRTQARRRRSTSERAERLSGASGWTPGVRQSPVIFLLSILVSLLRFGGLTCGAHLETWNVAGAASSVDGAPTTEPRSELSADVEEVDDSPEAADLGDELLQSGFFDRKDDGDRGGGVAADYALVEDAEEVDNMLELDQLSSDEEAHAAAREAAAAAICVQIVPQVDDVLAATERYRILYARMQEFLTLYHETGRRPRQSVGWRSWFLGCLGDSSVDAVAHTAEEMAESTRSLQRIRSRLFRRRATGVVFVTFTNPLDAKLVLAEYGRYSSIAQWAKRWLFRFSVHVPLSRPIWTLTRYSHVLRDRQWYVCSAPEPEDIQWTNVGIGRWEFRFRVMFLNVITAFMLMLWTTPLSFLHFLVSVPFLSLVYSQATSLFKWSQLDAFIVSLLLLALTLTLPNLIWASSWMEGHVTESAEHASIAFKTCLYLLFSLLILPVLWIPSLLTLFEAGLMLQDQAYTLLDGIFDQSNGSLAINLLVQMALIGNFVEALRVPERLMRVWMFLRAGSGGERLEAAAYAYRHEFGMQYAFLICVFAISLTFSAMIPLVPPFGVLYFIIKHTLDKYHLIYVRPRTFESDGSMIFLVLKFKLAVLLFFQLVVAVFFFIHGSIAQFVLVFSMPMFLLLFLVFNSLSAISLFRFTVLPSAVTVRTADDVGAYAVEIAADGAARVGLRRALAVGTQHLGL